MLVFVSELNKCIVSTVVQHILNFNVWTFQVKSVGDTNGSVFKMALKEQSYCVNRYYI